MTDAGAAGTREAPPEPARHNHVASPTLEHAIEPEIEPTPEPPRVSHAPPVPEPEPTPEPESAVAADDVPPTASSSDDAAPVVESCGLGVAPPASAPPTTAPPREIQLPAAPAATSAVLPVDVRRADGPSPFRSTADVTARETIEGSVAMPNAQFAAEGRPIAVVEGADANRTVENFLDLVSKRIGVVIEPAPVTTPPALPADETTLRVLHVDVDFIEDDMVAAAPMAPAWRPPHAAPAARPTSERAAVVVALLVGLILGFCLGLLASEWL